MSLFDALEFLDFIDLIRSWRFFAATLIGACAGLGLYMLLGQGAVGIIAGVLAGLAGAIWGLAWQSDHERIGRG